MKPLGARTAEESKRILHRKFTWCRLRNDFVDMPLWRVVSAELALPLYQVQAFVVRLESFANAALPRGYVGDFNAAEFGAALGMPSADAARIFELLERDEVGWVVQSHVSTFWERNPDKEDTGATERKQRERAFKAALKELAVLARHGRISEARRTELEKELHALRDLARSGALPWNEHRTRQAEVLRLALSTGHASHNVTGVTEECLESEPCDGTGLSTGHGGHNVTHRDIVTVTPRAEQSFGSRAVDNSGAIARRDTAGSPKNEAVAAASPPPQPEAWLAGQGKRVVLERMGLMPAQAELRIERWLRDVDQDAMALALAIDAADQATRTAAAFHVEVVAQIDRWRRDSADQRRLPLVQRLTGKLGGAA